ncbi:hypothetical protein QFC21_002564 [Naganishia friedmannii]|uniref:Uncharacterized protein n=1 Tax=Naganishia friedmannii TaxID=89922 RepID=A0ACC2VXJ3_9TREE|nr:hypothetical protein QFC21_002564 [Naganishia friedmannii]
MPPAPQPFSSKGGYPTTNFDAKPKHVRDLTRDRLNQFLGGHFSSQNLSALLFAHRIDSQSHPANIKLTYWSAPGRSKPGFEEAIKNLNGRGKEARKGMEFGPSWTNHWFKVVVKIPSSWQDYERVQFEFDGSGEAMVFTTEGLPLQGLTGGFADDRRVEFIIPEAMRKASSYTFYIESSCNGMFGINNTDPPDPNRYFRLESADLAVPNMEAWRLMWDFNLLKQITETLPWETPLTNNALYVANEIMNAFTEGSLESVAKCRKLAEKILGEDWEKEVVKSRKDGKDSDGTLWGVGHCHIDTAWLWPIEVTQQKSARSWSTQIDLMERYPEHTFSCTQAQQYKWVEQLYPLLFERIKAKVSEGRFQPVGATWVEMDTNMPSGEALARQFLYGQRYYKSRFGIVSPTFVLPDTFGYAAQLPQIGRLAGCKYFMTQKLSWSEINKFPHTTFNWVGLDGSQLLTHMTPVDRYNAQGNIDEIRMGMTGHKNLEVTSQSLLLFGNGDGGGGPTPPMLERLRRARAVAKSQNCGGGDLPVVKMGSSMDKFFESIDMETEHGAKLPNWRGELYLELHRGTYTTQAITKAGNRKCEFLLLELERAATLASLYSRIYRYPKAELNDMWEVLLLCQFHDTMSGSGIAMIHEDQRQKYRAILIKANNLLEEAYKILYAGSSEVTGSTKVSSSENLVAINPTPAITRREVIPVCLKTTPGLRSVCAQVNAKKTQGFIIAETAQTNPLTAGITGLFGDSPPATAQQIATDVFTLQNSTLDMSIKEGRITSIYDRLADRELIAEGMTGGFVIYRDHPRSWDAWEVDISHLETRKPLKFSDVRVLESGPVRATLACDIDDGASKFTIQISLDAIAASLKPDARSSLRFDCVVDWRERHKFLKFELPVDIHNDMATYDVAFGTLQRATHRNTSWEVAKFEVCAHKFVDLSDNFGYGCAILSESKYGYAVEGQTMRLSLLRAPTAPDPDADQGMHHFSFAIYPHVGTFAQSDVADVAYAFNTPMKLRHMARSGDHSSVQFPFSMGNAPNVLLETVKHAEDGGSIVLRAHEHMGGKAKADFRIRAEFPILKASVIDILENEIETIAFTMDDNGDQIIRLPFRSYEIKTIKLKLGDKLKKKQKRSGSVSSGGWVKIETE